MYKFELLPLPPIVAPHVPWGTGFASTLTKDASTQVAYFMNTLFLRRRFKRLFSLYSYVKTPNVDPPHPWGTWFEHTWIYTKWEYFHTSLSFSGWLVLENILNNVYKLAYILNYPPPWKRMYPFNYKLEPSFIQ